jgi:hypothetical protein
LAYGSVVVGGVGNNTCGGTFSLACGCFTVAPTICNAGSMSFVGGGFQNIVIGDCSSVVGGICNCILGIYGFVGGGSQNTASSDYGFIGSGVLNCVSNTSAVVNGWNNCACANFSFIGSGQNHSISCTSNSGFIGSGGGNTVSGYMGGVVTGASNQATGCYSGVVYGCNNCGTSLHSFVASGRTNKSTACYTAILGGCNNLACGIFTAAFGCAITNSIACSFAANQLWACNLVGTTVAVCVGTNGLLVRGASDCRLKTNICNISYGLCDVKKLNPVSFDWNEVERETRGCNRQVGFIAQEVEPIIPEAVGQQADNGEYSLSPDKIIPVLTKALQELSDKFDAQEERIAKLEDIIKRNNLI